MKWNLKLLALLAIFVISACKSKQTLVPLAIREYVEKHFVANGIQFEIIYNSKAISLVDETLKAISDVKGTLVREVQIEEEESHLIKNSAILIFDNYENYLQFEKKIDYNEHNAHDCNLLVVCPNMSTREFERTPRNSYGFTERVKTFYQLYQFLIEEQEQIFLKATSLFTPRECFKQQLIEINKFSDTTLQWTTTKFSMSKVDNFHGCSLSFSLQKTSFYESDFEWNTDKISLKVTSIKKSGFLFSLAEELATMLNFKIDMWLYDQQKKLHLNVQNNDISTAEEVIFMPLNIDWYLSARPITNFFYSHDWFTDPVRHAHYAIAVPPGASFTSEEKFILPFDDLTWILLALAFATAYTVVIVVRLSRSHSISDFVHGDNVTTPGLNVYGALMGIGQLQSPIRNVARILLMNFIIFSLIMRTAYQGVYFEFLTTDPHKKPISSLEELISKKWPMYTTISEKDMNYFSLEVLKSFKVHRVNASKMYSLMNEIQNSSFEGSIMELNTKFEAYSKYDSSNLQFDFIDFPTITLNYGLGFREFSFMYPSFKEIISRFIESGILGEWENRLKQESEIKAKKLKESNLVVLTMDHLAVGFIICLCMLSLSFIAFFAELAVFWIPRIICRFTNRHRRSVVPV